ncbi:MAG: trypsin-like peptidase domain-containing protein [Actinomycetota bacterium]|nr:trypsin-like peptidase domain-containing protein [Actinomycetota bacterium]
MTGPHAPGHVGTDGHGDARAGRRGAIGGRDGATALAAIVGDAAPGPNPTPSDAGDGPPTDERPGGRFDPRTWSTRARVVAVTGLCALAALAGSALTLATADDDVSAGDDADTRVDEAVAAALDDRLGTVPDPTDVYGAVLASVVFIRVGGDATTGDIATDPEGAVPDEQTPDEQTPDGTGSGPARSIGTGVVITEDGQILTANHVVDGATSITVTFPDGVDAAAEVISSDPTSDIAVLRTASAGQLIVPAVLGGGLAVGDDVFTVGHPLGLSGSFTAGVVSGLGRSIPTPDGGARLDDLIQFDAAVNPGSSGGPLIDANGAVVGIVTALADPSDVGYFVGIGFAVPIGTASGAADGGAPAR